LRSSSRDSALGLRAMRVRAPRRTSSASGVCATAAASSAALRRRSCLRAACTSRRALRACAPAAGVDEQAEQALGLRPALHRVLLVDLARVLGQAPDPRVGLVAAPDALLGQRLEHDLGALAALLARPRADDVDREVERLGVLAAAISCSARDAQLRVAVALDGGEQEAALELAGAVEVQHRPRAAPAARRDPRAGQRRPHVLLAVVEVLDRDAPQLALEDLVPALSRPRDRDDAALDAHPRPRPRRTGPTTIAPPR
jgi:hypothetical protein